MSDAPHVRLVVLACSASKREVEGLIPAGDLYTGGNYTVWNKAERDGKLPPGTRRIILSAEYGIIHPETEIETYDKEMTKARGRELRAECIKELQRVVEEIEPAEVFLAMGKTYRKAVEPVENWSNGSSVLFPKGRVGEKLSALKSWLRRGDTDGLEVLAGNGTGTAVQKPWMKDLPTEAIERAKTKAKEATKAWKRTVRGILTAARAIYEVREEIGGAPHGSFGAWAEEELGKSSQTAYQLAAVGARYDDFMANHGILPASWMTLYTLAQADDDVFEAAIPRVHPEMTRKEITGLLFEIEEDLNGAPDPDGDEGDEHDDPEPAPDDGDDEDDDDGEDPAPTALPGGFDSAKRITSWRMTTTATVRKQNRSLLNDERVVEVLAPEAWQYFANDARKTIENLEDFEEECTARAKEGGVG